MKFSEAMKALEEGKEVRCIRWPSQHKCSHGNLYTALVSHESIDYALEWEVYQESEKTYTFMETVKGLKEGKRFKRLGWENDDAYIVSYKEWNGSVAMEGKDRNNFIIKDFEATDWVEVK